MIVSITCRHETDTKIQRFQVNQELRALLKYDSSIIRTLAVFSKDTHHKNAEDLVTCHLSIHIPNRPQIDIYEHQQTEMHAFNRAKERAVKQITRHHSLKRAPHVYLSSIGQINLGMGVQ